MYFLAISKLNKNLKLRNVFFSFFPKLVTVFVDPSWHEVMQTNFIKINLFSELPGPKASQVELNLAIV
jgi:hypothetical protein